MHVVCDGLIYGEWLPAGCVLMYAWMQRCAGTGTPSDSLCVQLNTVLHHLTVSLKNPLRNQQLLAPIGHYCTCLYCEVDCFSGDIIFCMCHLTICLICTGTEGLMQAFSAWVYVLKLEVGVLGPSSFLHWLVPVFSPLGISIVLNWRKRCIFLI